MAVYDLELTPKQIKALVGGRQHDVEIMQGTCCKSAASGKSKTCPKAPDFAPPLPLWNGSRSQGPLVGHVSDNSAILWARVPVPGTYTLEVTAPGGADAKRSFYAVARESEDWCLRWEISELKANSTYHYRIARAAEILWEGRDFNFKTAPKTDDSVEVTLVFGSCANFESSPIWTRIKTEGADGVVLLGDTPYIDVTDLIASRLPTLFQYTNAERNFSIDSFLGHLGRS